MGFEVKNLFDVAQRDLEDVADTRGQRLQEPNVRNRRRQGDVPHALAANLRLNHFDAALFADNATMLHALVLAAVAFIVLDRTKDFCAEQAIAFGLECSVVDGLRLLHFAEGPFLDLLRGCKRNTQRVECERIFGLFEKIIEIAQCRSPFYR